MVIKHAVLIWMFLVPRFVRGLTSGNQCPSPHMELLSDDPRRTCTDISASKNVIEHRCSRRVKDLPEATIRYCPVEICRENGTWSQPSISCAMSECYRPGSSAKYVGHRNCTSSGRLCQSWDSQAPHKHKFKTPDGFPDPTLSMAASFCRDPSGLKGFPWCYTTDPDKKWETCDIPICYQVPASDKPSCEGDRETTTLIPSLPPECSPDRVKFQIQRGYQVEVRAMERFPVRSTLDCAGICGRISECTMFGYDPGDRACLLYDGDVASKLISSNKKQKMKFAVKICVPFDF